MASVKAPQETGHAISAVIIEHPDMSPMMLIGTNTTEIAVSLDTRLFWLMLMKPTVASIRKLILMKRKDVWPSSDSMSRRIWCVSSCWSDEAVAHQEGEYAVRLNLWRKRHASSSVARETI